MISRDALRSIHAASGALGLLVVAVFMIATIMVEMIGDPATIAAVKRAIVWGLAGLVPALVAAGMMGMKLSGGAGAGLAARKAVRMRIIAANGMFVLVPAAIFLARKAAMGAFDGVFYVVQGVELLAGATNIVLLALNMRDGLAMAAKRRRGGLV